MPVIVDLFMSYEGFHFDLIVEARDLRYLGTPNDSVQYLLDIFNLNKRSEVYINIS